MFVFYIYKHIQFNTISCKQKGKRVKPHVLKLIYGSPLNYLLVCVRILALTYLDIDIITKSE